MNRCEEVAAAYRAVTIKGAWYGPAVAELLERITPEAAIKVPAPGAHTIADLLQHLLLWNERIRKTDDSHPMPKWEADKEWAEPAIPWSELLARWTQSRDLLEERMRKFPVGDLAKQTPGRDYPYEFMWNGIVQHTIWHSGQIALVLGMVSQ